MSKRWVAAVVAAVLVVAVAAGGTFWWRHQQQKQEADKAAKAVLATLATGWSKKDLTDPAVPFEDTAVRDTFTPTFAGMGTAPVSATVDKFSRTGDRATAVLDVSWKAADDHAWTYSVPFGATRTGTTWQVTTPATGSPWVPGIAADDTVSLARVWGTRGDLLDADDKALMPMGVVYPVQLDPTRATAATATVLEKLVDQPAGSLVKQLAAATKSGSKAPIPVITYRQADFEKRSAALDALTGVIYPKTEQPLAASRTFGQPLLGSFGSVTAEMVQEQRPVCRGRPGRREWAAGPVRRGPRRHTGVQVTSSAGQAPLREGRRRRQGRQDHARNPPSRPPPRRRSPRTKGVPSALVAVDVKSGRRAWRREQPRASASTGP